MDFLPAYEFQKCVSRYRGDHKVQNFSAETSFLDGFAQLTYERVFATSKRAYSLSAVSSTTWGSEARWAIHSGRRKRITRLADLC